MSTQCAGTELIGPLVAQECRVSTVRIPVRLLLWLVGQECTICEKIIPKQLLLWLIAQECKDSDRRNPLLLLWWFVTQECTVYNDKFHGNSSSGLSPRSAGCPGVQGTIQRNPQQLLYGW